MDDDATVMGDSSGNFEELPAGTMLDNYRIERLLGRGGMGAVYLAVHVKLRKQYALKVLPQSLSRDADFRMRFENEAARMALLEHPGIVPVYYAGEAKGLHYFAMEYMAGGDVEARLHAHAEMSNDGEQAADTQADGNNPPSMCGLPPDEVRELLRQLLEALVYAHGKGIIHRDLKPPNLLLSGTKGNTKEKAHHSATSSTQTQPLLKIADFGLAQMLGPEYMRSLLEQSLSQSLLGQADTVIAADKPSFAGTIYFMAPEILQGYSATAQADLYSVGVIGYYLLTGKKPLGRYEKPSELVKRIGPGWDGFLDRLMASSPEKRFKTAEEVLSCLPRVMGKSCLVDDSTEARAIPKFSLKRENSGSRGHSEEENNKRVEAPEEESPQAETPPSSSSADAKEKGADEKQLRLARPGYSQDSDTGDPQGDVHSILDDAYRPERKRHRRRMLRKKIMGYGANIGLPLLVFGILVFYGVFIREWRPLQPISAYVPFFFVSVLIAVFIRIAYRLWRQGALHFLTGIILAVGLFALNLHVFEYTSERRLHLPWMVEGTFNIYLAHEIHHAFNPQNINAKLFDGERDSVKKAFRQLESSELKKVFQRYLNEDELSQVNSSTFDKYFNRVVDRYFETRADRIAIYRMVSGQSEDHKGVVPWYERAVLFPYVQWFRFIRGG